MPRPTLSQAEIDSFRQQIKATGYQMISEDGADSLTLRALARRLNCSYAKPYRYYQNKEELVDAVRGYAFDQFAEFVSTAGDRAGIPASERYLQFALEHPEPFRIMFELKQDFSSEETRKAEADAWDMCARPFHEAAEQGLMDEDPETAAHVYWVALHGLATLAMADKLNHGRSISDIAAALARHLPARDFLANYTA